MKLQIENHGSLWLARPLDDEAATELNENVAEETLWFGGALVLEPRYVEDFVTMFQDRGGEVV